MLTMGCRLAASLLGTLAFGTPEASRKKSVHLTEETTWRGPGPVRRGRGAQPPAPWLSPSQCLMTVSWKTPREATWAIRYRAIGDQNCIKISKSYHNISGTEYMLEKKVLGFHRASAAVGRLRWLHSDLRWTLCWKEPITDFQGSWEPQDDHVGQK